LTILTPEIFVFARKSTSNVRNAVFPDIFSKSPLFQANILGISVPHDILFVRWSLALDLFGRVFVDDVGLELGSIISKLGGFPVKEAKFRREMEKLRTSPSASPSPSARSRERGDSP
jgi:hypothetical protein